jgi:hypothetical protein
VSSRPSQLHALPVFFSVYMLVRRGQPTEVNGPPSAALTAFRLPRFLLRTHEPNRLSCGSLKSFITVPVTIGGSVTGTIQPARSALAVGSYPGQATASFISHLTRTDVTDVIGSAGVSQRRTIVVTIIQSFPTVRGLCRCLAFGKYPTRQLSPKRAGKREVGRVVDNQPTQPLVTVLVGLRQISGQ